MNKLIIHVSSIDSFFLERNTCHWTPFEGEFFRTHLSASFAHWSKGDVSSPQKLNSHIVEMVMDNQ